MSVVKHQNPESLFGLPDLITQVVTTGGRDLAYISGQVAWGHDGRAIGVGDHAAQAAQIGVRLDAILASLGADRTDIVKETIYVVDYMPELVPVILGALHGNPPAASTLVGVTTLYDPAFLIEAEFVVAIPEGGSCR
jgi:enamine deaminase RidA (YjgF/YER057c/UK114 family)